MGEIKQESEPIVAAVSELVLNLAQVEYFGTKLGEQVADLWRGRIEWGKM